MSEKSVQVVRRWTFLLALLVTAIFLPAPLLSQEHQREIDRLAEEVAGTVDKAGLKNVAVLDFTDLQGNVQELGRFMAEELTTSLVLKDRRFRTIDRANLRSILLETKLSMTGLVNPENAKKLKISGVDGLVRGTLTPFGESIRLTIQVIAVETAQIVGAARGVVPKTSAMDNLGGAIDTSEAQPGGGASSASSAPVRGRLVFQDNTLRITLRYFRRDSGNAIKAIFVIENISKTPLRIGWSEPQLVDDQGEQWRLEERSGIDYSPSIDALPPGTYLTALLVFKRRGDMGQAKKFSVLGPITVRDDRREWKFFPNIQDVSLGV